MKKYIIISLLIILIIGVIFIMISFKNKKEINSIKLLEYEYSDGRMINGNVSYKLECNDTYILSSKLKGYPDEEVFVVKLSKKDYSKILKLLQDNKVASWDGFNKADKHVLDGTSYTFKVVTNDDVKIYASGYMKYPKNYQTVITELTTIFDKANDKLYTNLLDHDNYKDFDINNVTKVIEEFYGEGGLDSKEYNNEDEIRELYDRFNNYKLGIETKMSCEDNTKKYRFITKDNKEFIIEEECNMIVLNNKRYVYRHR